jgi:type VI secretion system protein ImpK
MSPEVAIDVYPIVATGLALWRSAPTADVSTVPPTWGLLRDQIRRADENWAAARARAPTQFEKEAVGFPGIGFLLACWLDELFVLNSPWAAAWNESKLEAALYGTNNRAVAFWEVATAAERHAAVDPAAADAVEVCHLCAALGFRGGWASERDRLANWHAAVRDRLLATFGRPQPLAGGREFHTAVPLRRGRRRLRTVAVCGAVLLVLTVALVLHRAVGFSGF